MAIIAELEMCKNLQPEHMKENTIIRLGMG
jgi:hypothetical protein